VQQGQGWTPGIDGWMGSDGWALCPAVKCDGCRLYIYFTPVAASWSSFMCSLLALVREHELHIVLHHVVKLNLLITAWSLPTCVH
jgi:hypothetical protein